LGNEGQGERGPEEVGKSTVKRRTQQEKCAENEMDAAKQTSATAGSLTDKENCRETPAKHGATGAEQSSKAEQRESDDPVTQVKRNGKIKGGISSRRYRTKH